MSFLWELQWLVALFLGLKKNARPTTKAPMKASSAASRHKDEGKEPLCCWPGERGPRSLRAPGRTAAQRPGGLGGWEDGSGGSLYSWPSWELAEGP